MGRLDRRATRLAHARGTRRATCFERREEKRSIGRYVCVSLHYDLQSVIRISIASIITTKRV